MAKKSIVKSTFNRARPTPEDARNMAGKATGGGDDEKRERGRPKAEHDLKPFNTLIGQKQRARLKYLASMEGRHIYELVDEAFDLLFDRYGEQDKYRDVLK